MVDGSTRTSSSFLWDTFEINKYSCLNPNDLKNEISNFQEFIEALKHPNAKTTPGITQEIKTYAEILGDKISFLSFKNTSGINIKQRDRRKRQKKLTTLSQRGSSNQELLKTLQDRVYHAYQISRTNELRITNPIYKLFEDRIIQLEEVLHLKIDTRYIGGISDKDRSRNSDTDERVVSTMLWQSMFSNKPPVLTTRDKDFINLLGVLPKIIGSDDFLPYNKLFRRKIIENPFILYYTKGSRGDDYAHHLNNAYIDFDSEFKLGNISSIENQQVKQDMTNFWRQFSQVNDS